MSAQGGRRSAVLVAGLTVLAAILRLIGLNSGYWHDEISTIVFAVRPPLLHVATAFPGDHIHPLYGLMAKGTVAVFGEHPWSLRLPAVAFAVATAPFLYLLASALVTRTEALLVTLLLAVSYHHVWFSQNARGYTVMAFAVVVSTLAIVRLVERPRWGPAGGYAAAMGLGIYTHLLMVFVVAAHASVWAVTIVREQPGPRRSALMRAAVFSLGGALALGALLYLPMAGPMRTFISGTHYQRLSGVATPGWAVLELVRGLRIGFGTVGPLIVGVLATVGAVSFLQRNRLALWLFLLPGLMMAGALVVLGGSIRPRFFVALIGLALMLIVRGAIECCRLVMSTPLDARPARIGATIIVGVIAAASVISLRYNYRFPKQDFEGALRFIERNRAPTEPVLTAGAAIFPYERYYGKAWTPLEGPAQVEPLLVLHRRVWLVYSFPEYMDPKIQGFLEDRCGNRQRFPGTVGGGDIVVCTVSATGRREPFGAER